MNKHPLWRLAVLAALILGSGFSSTDAAILIARGAAWKYHKGTAEASTPVGAWRVAGFDDSVWNSGNAPFRYGDGSGGTELSDMRNNYSTLFLRRTFNVAGVALITRLDLVADYNDGFMVWINGNLVRSENAPANPTFDSTATNEHQPGSFETIELANPQNLLVEGANTIAIQVFNVDLASSNLMMNPELVATAPDAEPPVVTGFDPPPGSVFGLSRIAVTFSEPVTGVEAADLTINGLGADSVSGSGDQYTFTFASAPIGTATVEWSQDHGIADTAEPPNPFDATVPGEVRVYEVADEQAPTVTATAPPAGLTLRSLREVSVTFSEPVTGLEAGDLRIDGRTASAVTGSGAGPYLFTFE
ncbi:MAG: hypothetical protein GWO24_24500, partial [Akkermansiaceae bacterium]|nr:hypothetical protein [Akkermansiaceae bacterium]